MSVAKRPALKQAKGTNVSEGFAPKSPLVKDETLDYDKKSQVEHILLRPDAYIGSVEPTPEQMWVWDELSNKMVNKSITYAPGLYKIFDEILVNAADNKQRDSKMNAIKVEIDQENGSISVMNNGKCVPVEKHTKHKVYVPELVFGELLTSSNFDDGKKKVTGGRNGFGAKLTNIYSTEFIVETNDSVRGRKFKQTFRNNMSERSAAEVKTTGVGKEDYTKITFKPDLQRFGMSYLDSETISLMTKRVYDMAGCTDKSVKVWLNGKALPVKCFKDYINLYLPEGNTSPLMYEKINDRWEVAISVSDGSFQQVSFVNSICTSKGGKHLDYVADQMVNKFLEMFKKKHKNVPIKPTHIKNQLTIYMNCLVENPAFNSQTKEYMTTKSSSFGSDCALSDKLIKQVLNCGVVDNILNWAKLKAGNELKRSDGKKKGRVTGIAKLDDANQAGGKNAGECSLILTEGDSAKALAVSGLAVVGRDHYGVFPLKGKLLNVRDAAHKQIKENAEINNIKAIMGLQHGKVYEDTKSLRYGHIMIMADQDHDGSHIKGLVINMISTFWPSLMQIPGFIQEFVTPIVKVTKGKNSQSFFTQTEYNTWKDAHNEGKGWKIKYYKGLGTSSSAEAKIYFSDLEQHQLDFAYSGDQNDKDFDMAFNKKKADNRKEWLSGFDPEAFVDHSSATIDYSDFIHQELIHFSMADNLRSIPSMVDGLKPGQRKILFACFKRKLKAEIKVAQLAGYVSEHAAYHHGEASLCGTIINMAQDYVSSNNLNLLMPNGQFGTRIQGGKDAASPRYVFTQLNLITRVLFNELDDAVLNYLNDDGMSVEPGYYVPLIPMSLVNGSDGIGTGWSSNVPCYNPRDIVANIHRLMQGEEMVAMVPWYRGFTGTIQPKDKDPSSYTSFGVIDVLNDTTVEITELPVKKWTQDYKEFLESMIEGESGVKGAFIKEFQEYHTDTKAHFVVTLSAEQLALAQKEGLHKKFKLTSSLSTSNMHLFDRHSHIKKYDTPEQILSDFYELRMETYQERKVFMLAKLQKEWSKLSNRARFISMVVDGELVIAKKKKAALLLELLSLGFDQFGKEKKEETAEEADAEDDSEEGPEEIIPGGYDYLLGMPMWSLTMEKIETLTEEAALKKEELSLLESKSLETLYTENLEGLEEGLEVFENAVQLARQKAEKIQVKGNAKKGKGKAKKAAKKKVMAMMDDSDELDEVDFDDSEDDSDFEGASKKKKPAAKKAAAKKPAVAVTKPAVAAVRVQPPAPKAAAPKAAPKAAVKASKTESPPAPPKPVEPEEEVEMSLLERLALREKNSKGCVSPQLAEISRTKPAARAKKTAARMDSESDSEEEAVVVAPKRKAAARAKKVVVAIDSDSESDFSEDDAPVAPKRKLAARQTKKPVASSFDFDSEEESDFEEKAPAPAKKKAAPRAKKAAPKIESDSEESDFEEKAPAPAKKKAVPAKKAAPKRSAPSPVKKAAPVVVSDASPVKSPSRSPPMKKAKPAGRAASKKAATFKESESEDQEDSFSMSEEESEAEESDDFGSDSDF